jgi:hydroxymethylpyrimidine pyrophosphatase-like HAD family hydrolase
VTWGSETLTNVLIPQDLLRETLMLMIEHNMDFWLEGPDHVYLDAKTHPEFYQAFIDSFPAWPDLFMDFRVKNPLRINKFSYLLQSGSRFDAVRSFLIRHYDVIFHRDEQGEVVPCGYSKATGMDLIRRRLGNPDVVTFAFGDSLNDLAMFQAADVGIAMDGSHSRLIASSSHLTASPDEHGIERALRYYQLIS